MNMFRHQYNLTILTSYPTQERGAAEDVWLKDSNGNIYVGDVWPGYAVFPDWHHPKAEDFWTNELLLWKKRRHMMASGST